MRVPGFARITVVCCFCLGLLPLAASAQSAADGTFNAAVTARKSRDIVGYGSSSGTSVGLDEGSPGVPSNKGTCYALGCSAVLKAVCTHRSLRSSRVPMSRRISRRP